MKKPSIRSSRVADLIQRELAVILRKEVNDPRLRELSITHVDLSPDLRNAAVYYSMLNDDAIKEINQVLSKAQAFFRKELASRTDLRYVPKISFKYDVTLKRAEKLANLLSQAGVREPGDSNEVVTGLE